MASRAWFFIFSVAFILPGYESTACYVQNSIPGLFTQTCPGNVYQCMQFRCRIDNPRRFDQITKGCNDPGNAATSCTVLMTNCQTQGGLGQCFTCTGDYCNSSKLFSLKLLFIIPLFIFYFNYF